MPLQGLANRLAVHVRIAVHIAAHPGSEAQDVRHVQRFNRHGIGVRQRRLDFLIEQRHDAVEDVDQIKQYMLAFVNHGQAFTRMLLGLPDAGDLQPYPRPQHVQFRPGGSWIGTVQQLMRNVLLLAQDGAPCGFGGMRREYRLNAHVTDELQRLFKRHAAALQPSDAIGDSARLRCAGIAQVFAAPAYAVRFFCRVHRHEPY